MKRAIAIIVPTIILLSLLLNTLSCSSGKRKFPQSPVVILFDNDVHCAVDGYAALAALKETQRLKTQYVATVSCGDFVQGEVIGTISRGEAVVDIMNMVGYDCVTVGNHEFDFGIEQHFALMDKLEANVVCANFFDLENGTSAYPPYEIFKFGNVEIAFLGIATPATLTSVSPKTFLDKDGNRRYSFGEDDFYTIVQQSIDNARKEGADYVVVLSHLGDIPYGENPTSTSLISNTMGIDAVLDGHAHSVIPDSIVQNRLGKPVHLVSSGTKFENIGLLTLSTEGKFSGELVPVSQVTGDAGVSEFVGKIKEKVVAEGEKVVGECSMDMPVFDVDGSWLVRKGEAAIGTFCADAFRIVLGTDIAMINSGGIRAGIEKGPVTFNDLLSVFPFNNTACIASVTGAQLLDALETSVMFLPYEDGSYMQVSGVRFKTDISVPTPVVIGEDKLFSHVGSGRRRVSSVEVLDKISGKYEPVDLSRRYTLAGISYNIVDLGSNGIFRYARLQESNLGQDVEILLSYLADYK